MNPAPRLTLPRCLSTTILSTTIMMLAGSCVALAAPPPSSQAPAEESHRHTHEVPEKLGKVVFPVSCGCEASVKFERATALLHSFVYEEAENAFKDVVATDSSCAMGYWGIAMTRFHPIWAAANPSAAPSPEDLQRGREAIGKAKQLNAKTARERGYIAAVDSFYAAPDGEAYLTRATAFATGMEQLYLKYPSDREAAVFYALALLGTAPVTDKSYAVQKKAAGILNKLLPDSPDHPGIAHYLIHSFDYPSLAALALPAARAYSKIAPSAPHALHMPSHIFTRLGLWDESIDSNLASAEAARRLVARLHPGASSFDEMHALDYLVYAYLQTGRDGEARGVVERIRTVERLDVPNFAAAYALAAVPARYALERRAWDEAAALNVAPASFPWEKFSYAEAITQFARAIGAARGSNPQAAAPSLARLTAIQQGLVEAKDGYWADQVEIQRRTARAWVARAEGRNDEALKLMHSAADLEDADEKHPVTPGAVLPARELLGDLLFELGEPAKAIAEYTTSLGVAPGRFNSLIGAARAAAKAGDNNAARVWYAKLLSACGSAGQTPSASGAQASGLRPDLAEARAFIAR